jgi:predicted PurR-regulated permease PerM
MGISSFWVLFSLLIFGGLFGVVGMLIGVPLFSILYSFINGVIKRKLKEKKLPQDSKDYEKLLYISEKTGKPVYEK